jgi:hypothetical protein
VAGCEVDVVDPDRDQLGDADPGCSAVSWSARCRDRSGLPDRLVIAGDLFLGAYIG